VSIHNIEEYRRAQQYVKDLTKIVKILAVTQASLMNYVKYKAVVQVLTTIGTYKPILEIALEENKIIEATKGAKRL
jgi:hypothetical protein